MNRLLPPIVFLLVIADVLILGTLEKMHSQPPPPDLTPRVAQLEKDLSQAQQDIGELKQEMQIVQRHGSD